MVFTYNTKREEINKKNNKNKMYKTYKAFFHAYIHMVWQSKDNIGQNRILCYGG